MDRLTDDKRSVARAALPWPHIIIPIKNLTLEIALLHVVKSRIPNLPNPAAAR